MQIPEGLKFTKEHEWIHIEENIATVGISDFAQNSLGDITFIQLPSEGQELKKDDTFGVVESVKTVSDLYSPVSGRVIEVNQPLLKSPELINEDPYIDGWMIKIEMGESQEAQELMSSSDYQEYIKENS